MEGIILVNQEGILTRVSAGDILTINQGRGTIAFSRESRALFNTRNGSSSIFVGREFDVRGFLESLSFTTGLTLVRNTKRRWKFC